MGVRSIRALGQHRRHAASNPHENPISQLRVKGFLILYQDDTIIGEMGHPNFCKGEYILPTLSDGLPKRCQ